MPVVILGCPPVVFFDEPEIVKHFTRRSVHTLERWEADGLTIHTKTFESGRTRRFIVLDEYVAFLKLTSNTEEGNG